MRGGSATCRQVGSRASGAPQCRASPRRGLYGHEPRPSSGEQGGGDLAFPRRAVLVLSRSTSPSCKSPTKHTMLDLGEQHNYFTYIDNISMSTNPRSPWRHAAGTAERRGRHPPGNSWSVSSWAATPGPGLARCARVPVPESSRWPTGGAEASFACSPFSAAFPGVPAHC